MDARFDAFRRLVREHADSLPPGFALDEEHGRCPVPWMRLSFTNADGFGVEIFCNPPQIPDIDLSLTRRTEAGVEQYQLLSSIASFGVRSGFQASTAERMEVVVPLLFDRIKTYGIPLLNDAAWRALPDQYRRRTDG